MPQLYKIVRFSPILAYVLILSPSNNVCVWVVKAIKFWDLGYFGSGLKLFLDNPSSRCMTYELLRLDIAHAGLFVGPP